MPLIEVLLPIPLEKTYTYNVPATLPVPKRGMRVLVPFGRQKNMIGLVFNADIQSNLNPDKIKDIISVLDDEIVVTESQFWLWQWIAQYYICPLGDVMDFAMPNGLLKKNIDVETNVDFIQIADEYAEKEKIDTLLSQLQKTAKKQYNLFLFYLANCQNSDGSYQAIEKKQLLHESNATMPILQSLINKGIFTLKTESKLYNKIVEKIAIHRKLTPQQEKAVQLISTYFQQNKPTLLFGVTSSGKTEVYVHLIQQKLAENKNVLYLVPEIALTTQLQERLQSVFPNRVLAFHSRCSDSEKVRIYRTLLQSDQSYLVLGVRSSVFLPFQRLGLIIVDEEQDDSYKQQDPAPRYNARTVAVMLAKRHNANILLGTATPSIETYHLAQSEKYGLVKMTERYQSIAMPKIKIVDLTEQYHRKTMQGHFSDFLIERMQAELAKGKQIILFQNRRGYSPSLLCKTCGYVPKCPNCDVNLTYHKNSRQLHCHYCGYVTPQPAHCPNCKNVLTEQGFGTERLEEEIATIFPNARFERMDLDTTRRKNGHKNIINRFASHDIDILIGTQMITKGLHFDGVSLVGVLNADNLMIMPDFRSEEKTFQVLEQVAGRCGRQGEQGEVIIQTFQKTLPIFSYLEQHDYLGFYEEQIQARQLFHYPPFHRIIRVNIKHSNEQKLADFAMRIGMVLKQIFGSRCTNVIVPTIQKVNKMFIRHIIIKLGATENLTVAKEMLKKATDALCRENSSMNVYFDVDPI